MSSCGDKNYLDIIILKGATFKKVIVLKDGSDVPMDLTGWTGKSQIRPTPSSVDFYDFVVTITNPLLGEITWEMDNIITSSILEIKGLKYYYDLELTDTNGDVYRILQGFAYISPEVTRP